MKDGLKVRTTTLVWGLSLSLLAGCTRAPQPLDEQAIQEAAMGRFLEVRDTLALQYIAACDSLQPALVQRKVDSLVMDYFQRNDTLSLDMGAYGVE